MFVPLPKALGLQQIINILKQMYTVSKLLRTVSLPIGKISTSGYGVLNSILKIFVVVRLVKFK